MSKERLEELIDDITFVAKSYNGVESLINYAREQAERVQELEHDKEHHELIKERQEEEYRNVYEQNKRYREARGEIEFLYDRTCKKYPNPYESGRLDGLDIAMSIIDEALEGEE